MTRLALLAVTVTAASLVLVGCSGTDEPAPAADGASAPSGGAFPVTIEHTFGETTIEAAPQRVVTIGFNEQDFALALGTTPVGTREALGFDASQRPWAQDVLPDEPIPTVGAVELDVEAVAALEPDLILGVYSFMEEADYEQLSQIAPTVAESADHELGGTPWQEQTRMTGQALGAADEAEQLVADVEAQFADAAAANPSFAGQSFALDYVLEGTHTVFSASDLRTRFFTDLGFTAGTTSGELSQEQLTGLDGDVLVVAGGSRDELLGDPLFAGLPVVADDRTVYLGAFDDPFPQALGFTSPLSLPYALELVLPALSAASDGDPATPVEPLG